MLLGRLLGESFYRGRPTHYWRAEMRAHLRDPRAGWSLPQPLLFALEGLGIDLFRLSKSRWSEPEYVCMEGDPDALPVLRKLARGGPEVVRLVALRYLGTAGAEGHDVVADLTAACADANPRVQVQAITALWQATQRPELVLPTLAELLQGPDMLVRYQAVSVITLMGPEAAPMLPRLLPLLQRSDPVSPRVALGALASLGPSAAPAVPQMLQALDDPALRPVAAWALGAVGPAAQAAVPRLTACMNDPEETLRISAAASLCKIDGRSEAGMALLLHDLDNRDLNKCIMALRALSEMGPAARVAVPALTTALHYPAVECLGKLGPAARSAVPALVRSGPGDSPHDRRAVLRALERIDPETAARCRAAPRPPDLHLRVWGWFLLVPPGWLLWGWVRSRPDRLLLAQGRYAEAEDHFRRSLNLLDRFRPDVALVLNNLGILLTARCRLAEAQEVLHRAQRLCDEFPTVAPAGRAETCINLGQLAHARGLLHEARQHYDEARKRMAEAFGEDHIETAVCDFHLGRLDKDENDCRPDRALLVCAEARLHRCVNICAQTLGPGHGLTGLGRCFLGCVLAHLDHPAEARIEVEAGLAILPAAFGEEHPVLGVAYLLAGEVALCAGSYEEALSWCRRGTEWIERHSGPEHGDLSWGLYLQGRATRRGGRPDEAEPLLRRALAVCETAYGPEHPLAVQVLEELAGLLEQTGRGPEAAALRQQAAALRAVVLSATAGAGCAG